MSNDIKIAIKFSLAFLWLFTGLTSLFFAPEVGYSVLSQAGITGGFAKFCLISGAILDLTIGLWLLTSWRPRLCCVMQIAVILIFMVLLSFIAPSFWLHPFGPQTKNIPIIVLIFISYFSEKNA